jgi:LysM repeat protein
MTRRLAIALSIVALCAAYAAAFQAQAPVKMKTVTASGAVKSVSNSSLVVTGTDGKDMTFTVDNTTTFVGKGLSTKSANGPLKATDAVKEKDKVSVTYHVMAGGTLHAANVRITTPAAAK